MPQGWNPFSPQRQLIWVKRARGTRRYVLVTHAAKKKDALATAKDYRRMGYFAIVRGSAKYGWGTYACPDAFRR